MCILVTCPQSRSFLLAGRASAQGKLKVVPEIELIDCHARLRLTSWTMVLSSSLFFGLIVFWFFFPITPPFSLEYRASLYTRLEAKRLRLTEENKANRPRSDLDATDSDSEKQVTLCDNTCHAKRFGVYLMATANVYKCEQLVRYESDKLFFLPLIHKTTLA